MSFESFGLGAALVTNCARAGYTVPSPIQQQAIPKVMAGHDLLAAAQTGTGKTAAFLLPLLHAIGCANPPNDGARSLLPRRTPRVLVLAPTRELAAQIGESARTYGAGLNVRSQLVYGGVSQRPQAQSLARGVDLLIATPGRLLDLHTQRLLDLSQVAHVVLDEADRMLDMGFIRDLRRIVGLLPKKRQTLLFSATFSADIRSLAAQFLTNPERIEIAPEVTSAERVTHHVVRTNKNHKRALLAWLIGHHRWEQVLVFARTKHGADRLARQMTQDGLPTVALHGGKTQSARTRALAGFKAGDHRVLVATDIAARGLDISQLPCVINYELPNVPEDYVHRIGRTGRAGASGLAISLVGHDERGLLRDIEKVLRLTIPVMEVDGFVAPDPSLERARDAAGDREARETRDANRSSSGKPRRQGGGGAGRGRPAAGAAARRSGQQPSRGPRPAASGERRSVADAAGIDAAPARRDGAAGDARGGRGAPGGGGGASKSTARRAKPGNRPQRDAAPHQARRQQKPAGGARPGRKAGNRNAGGR